ncbi:MAG: hypothetical protein RJA70_2944, partial [Pseudomonadota bacterium]
MRELVVDLRALVSTFALMVCSGACTSSGEQDRPREQKPPHDAGKQPSSLPNTPEAGSESPVGGDGGPIDEPTGPDLLAGVFIVELVAAVAESEFTGAAAAYASTFGRVSDGATPSTKQWNLIGEEGNCKLLKPFAPACEKPCGATALCVGENKCAEYPTPLDIGKVTLRGVALKSGKPELVMTALPPSNNYQPIGEQLAYPPFEEAALVSLESSGGSIEPLRLSALGVAPLVLMGDEPLLLEP